MRATAKINSAQIDTPAKRGRLDPAHNPYWQGISGGRGGVTLGYHKPKRGTGSWFAKIVDSGVRHQERIAIADDPGAPAGALSYPQATRAALDWARQKQENIKARASGEPTADPTIADAVADYIAQRAKRSKRGGKDAESRLRLHVLSDEQFAQTRLSKLSAANIKAWRARLTKGRTGAPPKSKKAVDSKATPPARPLSDASVNRLLNDLRAALNASAETHRRTLPAHVLAEIKIGTRANPDATEARRQVLTDADVRALVAAAYEFDPEGDFGRLVHVLAATGARFSQVTLLTVADVQVQARRIMMPAAGKGRVLRAKPKIAIPVDADLLVMLAPALNGRKGSDRLLLRWRHKQVSPTVWEKVERGPWTAAAEMTRPWAQVLTLAGQREDVVPYALRHSSIVRHLREGVPIRMVASLHDTSSAMIERHYASFILDATEEIARRAIVPLLTPPETALRAVS